MVEEAGKFSIKRLSVVGSCFMREPVSYFTDLSLVSTKQRALKPTVGKLLEQRCTREIEFSIRHFGR